MENLEMTPSFWNNKRVLITGHTGFKGSWLSIWLKKLGAEVIGFSNLVPTYPSLYELSGINSDIIEFIVEDNPLKHNKIIPGVNIPIYDVDYLIEKDIKVVIVLAWNFFDYIVDKNKSLIDKGVRFISIKELEDPNFNF